MKRFVLYLARWQASTPVLWLVVSHSAPVWRRRCSPT